MSTVKRVKFLGNDEGEALFELKFKDGTEETVSLSVEEYRETNEKSVYASDVSGLTFTYDEDALDKIIDKMDDLINED